MTKGCGLNTAEFCIATFFEINELIMGFLEPFRHTSFSTFGFIKGRRAPHVADVQATRAGGELSQIRPFATNSRYCRGLTERFVSAENPDATQDGSDAKSDSRHAYSAHRGSNTRFMSMT